MANQNSRANKIKIVRKNGMEYNYEGTVHFTKDSGSVICVTLLNRDKIFIPLANIDHWTFRPGTSTADDEEFETPFGFEED